MCDETSRLIEDEFVKLFIVSSSQIVSRTRLLHYSAKTLASIPLIVEKRRFSAGSSPTEDNKGQPASSYEEVLENMSNEAEEEEEYERSIRHRILNASLNHVLQHGWTKKALEAGAQSEGLPPIAHGMFERGGAETVHHFYRQCNKQLVEYMKKEVEEHKAEGEEKLKTRSFIQKAVEARLRMIIPYHTIWKEAMGIQALPQNAPEAWKNLMNLCDDIWYFAGDKSTDFDWYTKRLSLAAIYKATEIYMLQDSSPDFQDSWLFLDNRLNDLSELAIVKKSLEPLKEGLMGLLEMGRNMAGMNSRNR